MIFKDFFFPVLWTKVALAFGRVKEYKTFNTTKKRIVLSSAKKHPLLWVFGVTLPHE